MGLIREKSYYKNLFALAVPISLQNLVTFSIGFADNVMIGRLGDAAVSGVFMGNQIQAVFQMFMMGVEGALLILAAQYWGKKDTNSIKKIMSLAFKIAILFAVLFSLVTTIFPEAVISILTNDPKVIQEGAKYLGIMGYSFAFFAISHVLIASMRSVEIAKIGLYVSLMTLVVDVGLNYIFIFGIPNVIPAYGVQGAATATLIARFVEAAAMVLFVKYKDKKLNFRLKDLSLFDKDIAKDYLKYGLPVLGGQVVWGCNTIGQSMILGRFDSEVIAATSIIGMLHNLVYIWMTGLSSAVGITTGKTVGSGDISRVKDHAHTVQIIYLIIGVISGIAVALLGEPFTSLYDISPEAKAYAMQFVAVISITIVGTCYQAACLAGLVKSGGDISFVFKNDTIFVFLVVLPAGIITWQLGFPVWIVFAALKSDQIFKCFVAVVKINKFNWIKNLTRESKA